MRCGGRWVCRGVFGVVAMVVGGMFVGMVASALGEILEVAPVLMRRFRLGDVSGGGTGDDSLGKDTWGDNCFNSDYALRTDKPGSQKGQGTMSLAGSRGGAPLWGLGQRPNCSTGDQYVQRAQQKVQAAKRPLPVTSRFLRSAPKLLFPTSVLCRAKWARPTCLSFRHSNSFPQAGDFASAEATKGQWKRTKSAIAL